MGSAALAVASLFILHRPQRGLLILAALTPLNGLLIILPDAAPAWWKEALLLVTVAAAVTRSGLRAPARLNVPWWPAIAVLVVIGCVSAVLTHGSLGWIPIKITFCYLLVVVALWFAPLSAADRDRLVTVIMVGGTLNALWGVAQQVLGAEFLLGLGYEYGQQVRFAGDSLRSFGTFVQPFGYGLFLMLTILIGVAVALDDPRRRRNQVFLWLLPVLVAGLAASVVRASFVGLAVGLLWIGVLRHRKLLAAAAAAAVVAVPAVLVFAPRGALATVFSPDSFSTRAQGWGVTWSLILDRPLGAGLGSAGSAAQKIVTDALQLPESFATRIDGAVAYSIGLPYQPDNYYMKMLIELGPLGLWFFVMFLVAAAVSTLHVARSAARPADAGLAVGVGALRAAAAVASLVSTYLEIFPMDYFTWLLLGAVGCIPLSSSAEGSAAVGESAPREVAR
ncbi:O-antigen ligase family protein [Mycobacterium sp. ACS4331]|uniref:O-antigen ligase family protein n=1 Tax=Mycobacterium sp. ACS4331 TaxID=1834121 RepID=UPI0009ED7960|nr:O-antigen ligase family protein [Mycobacterium sp. ACS4331]